MPSREDFTPHDLAPWLGHLALVEAGAGDFRVRLCGAGLIRRFGREATGARVADLAKDIALGLRETLARATATRAPVFAAIQIPLGDRVAKFSELALPLADAEGAVGMLMLCSREEP